MNDRSVAGDNPAKASIAATEAAWAASDLTPAQRLVLLRIAYRVNNRSGDAFPSYASLAADCGLSERGVRYAVDALIAAGHVKAQKTAGKVTHYVVPDEPTLARSATPEESAGPALLATTLATSAETPALSSETLATRATEPLTNHSGTTQEPRTRAKRKTYRPDDLTLTAKRREVALGVGMTADTAPHQWQQFLDWHEANDKGFVDWEAGWRTWCRNWVNYGRKQVSAGRRTVVDENRERDARVMARLVGGQARGPLAALEVASHEA